MDLFNWRLQISIREGTANGNNLTSILSTLTQLDPFQITDTGEFGFLWIAEVLNSGYAEGERYQMASRIVGLLGKHFYSVVPERVPYLQPSWISPLLGFLSLCEKFYMTESPPHPAFIALRILSSSPRHSEFDATILPVLASILLPTHPLQSRSLALKIFHGFMSGWLSSQMKNLPGQDLNKLLQAVGDPFQFTSDPPSQEGQHVFATNYQPVMVIVVLIEFASSDLWRDHLHCSNFASCEELVSTEEGKRTVLESMLYVATHLCLEFLHTPAKITAAARHLEDLQCLNTAEVVIMWAWTTGVIDPIDHNAWRSIGHDTLRFCQTNRMGCPTALKRHIMVTDTSTDNMRIMYLIGHYEGTPCQVGSVRRPTPALWVTPQLSPRHFTDLRVSQACQLRILCRLFEYDPTMLVEVAAAEEEDQAADMLPEDSVAPVSFVGWVCDYP